ncbi:hypothetical protein [Nocardia miyunensis]|uniref:hypothetical protein n=1 Tax=Nocardia miyunensis TaxID=282684 RepID=UPI000834904C|nr:hypothetical protein [Nocardia miyunensis]
MTRDLPLDADAEDPGDHAGDTAYRVATGVARVARAGAYVTGGALVAEGSQAPENNESHDASRIAGWSLQDPQPNAPSPVVTYPDPSPDSVPPVLGHPGAAASDHPQLAFPNLPPGFEFHVQIETGPDAASHPPDLSKIPGVNSMPGTDGSTPGLSVVPGPSVGSVPGTGTDHLPGTGTVPGLGNGVPGLGNGVPGLGNGIPNLGNGIPGFGNTPGTGDSPFDLPSVPAMPSVPSVPEFQIPKLNSGNGGSNFNLPGIHPAAAPIAAESGQDATLTSLIHPADASIANAANGFQSIDLGDRSASSAGGGAGFGPLGSENDALHMVSGFDGVGSAESGVYADVQVHLDAHAGLDGVWLNLSAQAAGGVVGGIGEQIDTYGRWLGGGESAPADASGPESVLVQDLTGQPHGIRSGMGIPGPDGAGPAHGPLGAAGLVPAPGVPQPVVPGVVIPANVPATAALSPSLPAAGPVASSVPASVAAPAAVTTPAVVTSVVTAPQPAVIAAPPVPQPVVTTPLQPAAHPDAALHTLAGALPDHLGPVPLGAAAAVGPAAFLGLSRPAPATAGPTSPGPEHGANNGPTVGQPLTGTFDHSLIPHVSIPAIPPTGILGPAHVPKPPHPTYGPTTGPSPSHVYGPSTGPRPSGTPSNGHGAGDSSGATSTIAGHPSPTLTDDSTTDSRPTTVGPSTAAHPGSDAGTASATSVPSHESSTPTRDSTSSHDASPSRDATPTHDSSPADGPQPSHAPTSTYDSGPTRQPVPTHDSSPAHEVPLPTGGPSVPSHVPTMPTMPGHDNPPAATAPHIPDGYGGGPGVHTAPHAPMLPPMTMSPHFPMKPIASVHDSSDYSTWQDSGHAGLAAAPTGLSSGLLPGTQADPAHTLIHPAPDLHIAL